MQRLLLLAAGYAVTLAAIVIGTTHRYGAAASAHAAPAFLERFELLRQVRAEPPERGPLVAWMGDSSMLTDKEVTAYPDLMTQVTSWPLRIYGMDPFGYYLLLQPVLARHPRVLVLIANLRLIGTTAPRDFTSLADLLPLVELPRALLLPWYARGVSLPRLVLLRALRSKRVHDRTAGLDALRQLYQENDIWRDLDLTKPPGGAALYAFFAKLEQQMDAYDVPLTGRTPGVRMLRACVARATAAGIPTLVVVAPIPVDKLREYHRYDAARYAARINVLRDVVTASGGELLDLHDDLDAAMFRDLSGHPTQIGHSRLAAQLEPEVLRMAAAPR